MTQTNNKSAEKNQGWAGGCGCLLVGYVGLGLYLWSCFWVWKVWLSPYFVEIVHDTKESVGGMTESLGRILGLQGYDWLLTFITWLFLIGFIGNRVWATIQPKVLRKYLPPLSLRGGVETSLKLSVLVPASGIILALAASPFLMGINRWVNADGATSWRRTVWNLLMGDFCFKHNIVAAYFLFAPVVYRWYLKLSFHREAIVFGYRLGETLSSNRDDCREIPEEEKSHLFDDVRMDNECRKILSRNVVRKKNGDGLTFDYYLVPNTRVIYMLVLNGHGEKEWKKVRQRVESLFMSYKVKWTFPKNGISVVDEIFMITHQFKFTLMQFECDSAYRFNLRLVDKEEAGRALGQSRVVTGRKWGHPKWKWKNTRL